MLDWNDLRYFLAVAETGSTLAAGRRLRVSQTTVARRVAALEAAIGLVLFERRQSGYALTAAGEALLGEARGVEAAGRRFADTASAQIRDIAGTIRLTVTEIYAVSILGPILRDFHDAHPSIRIEVDTSETLSDLGAGAADVALRTTDRPSGAGVFGRRLRDDDWAIYCSRDYAARHGHPTRRTELGAHPIIGGGEPKIWRMYHAWLAENGLLDKVAMHYDTATGLLAAVRGGFGLATLPCTAADADPDLLQCLPPAHDSERGLWLLSHERVRHVPRVRLLIDFLAERLARR
jgi:DNA-binding transcriptional LysR family regulator